MNAPTPPYLLYRFRSIDALLDKYHELENQTIYFASPEELNDPMEGLRDIVWRGDRIVWTNFFKHYVYCLHTSYFLFHLVRDSGELHECDIPILANWNQIWRPEQQQLFDDIWHRFLCLPHMPDIIRVLSDRSRPIRGIELRSYLQTIQSVFLDEIEESYISHGIKSKPNNASQSGVMPAHALLELVAALILELETIKTEEEYYAELRTHEALYNNHRIRHLREIEQWTAQQDENPISAEIIRNSQLVIPDFPSLYLNRIEELLWPKWYTACFMEHYYNSSVWGHYGDKHQGGCLIFEFPAPDAPNSFQLHHLTSQGDRPTLRFSKVSYTKTPGEVDFFRSLGMLSADDLMKLWYTDREGNISECAAHLLHDNGTYNWIENYRENIYHDITSKTEDWKYEQEYRLVLSDWEEKYYSKEGRTLRYDFNSLKGIIFGIQTSDDDKLRIIEIVEKKRAKHKRTDFKYYQAHYSPETGDIRKYEIQLS